MGLFPYECKICGGAYKKCNYKKHCKSCKGGQMCWEEDVMIKTNYGWIVGKYDGNGYVIISKEKYNHDIIKNLPDVVWPIQFSKYFKYWTNEMGDDFKTCEDVQCLSCWEKLSNFIKME